MVHQSHEEFFITCPPGRWGSSGGEELYINLRPNTKLFTNWFCRQLVTGASPQLHSASRLWMMGCCCQKS